MAQLKSQYPALLLKPSFWTDGGLPTSTEALLARISQDFEKIVDGPKLPSMPQSTLKSVKLTHPLIAKVLNYKDIATPVQKQYDENEED